jgi:AraC-like DNA-binding protein
MPGLPGRPRRPADQPGLGAPARDERAVPVPAELGISPDAWRTRARLLAAVPLLHEQTITQVASGLGYSSPASFTAAFSRAFGVPPSVLARSAATVRAARHRPAS